jgi:hypothetical protein
MQSMKGATMALGSMNRTMNLPALQRIAMEFERENDIMEQRQEMMDDAIDDAMDTGLEEEGDEVVEQVLEEIGVDLNQKVSGPMSIDIRGWPTNHLSSLAKHQPAYTHSPISWPRAGWPRLLVVEVVEAAAAAVTRVMMISRRDSTA